MYASQIVKNVNGEDFTMAVLVMHVNCFQFQGKVYIAFDELGDVLDSMIETGGMTKEEYQAKEKDFVCSLWHQPFWCKFSVKHKETVFILMVLY